MKPRATIFFLFLMLLAINAALKPATLFAQDATGKVTGEVHDQQGAVVQGAKITVQNTGTGVTSQTTSDKDGAYQVLQLPIGNYRVIAEQDGFQKVVTTGHALGINQTLKMDVTLVVGGSSETVEVSGAAAQVETQNATLGNSVTNRPIVDLPLNGRNVLQLAALEAGVTESNPGNASAGSFSISGGRTDSVTYLLDGGVNNNLLDNGVVFNPNPDTIAEFRILESNYNAEYGRNAGGVISVVTKSGTNVLHGSIFDFARNDAFDANSFFNKNAGLPREILKRQQFGATLGGPVVLPKLYDGKDKAFFFVSYQGQRQTQTVHPDGSTWTFDTFTPAMANGDFSQSPYAADLATFLQSNPYYQADPAKAAQGIMDPTKISPVAQNYLSKKIIPVTSNGVLTPTSAQLLNQDELTAKFDYNFTASDRLTTTVGWGNAPGNRPFAGGATSPFYVNDQAKKYFLNLSYTKSITANVLNEVRFTAQRFNDAQGTPAYSLPTGPDLGVAITPDLLIGPPIIYFNQEGSTYGFSYRGPVVKINNTFQWNDTLTWVKGKHTMKYGFMFSPYQNNTQYAYQVSGEFDFYGSTTGSDLADFLVGAPDEFMQSSNAPSNIRSKSYGGFAQDEWRVNKHLTLTLGLRYEYNAPKSDTLGRSFSFKWGAQSTRFPNAPVGLLFPGDPQAPNGANFPDKNDFAPRFGFAWDPTGNGKMSVRGGFGVFYDILKGEDNLQFNGQAPFNGYADIVFDPWTSAGASPYLADPYGSTGTVNTSPSKMPPSNMDFDASGFLPFAGSSVYFVDPNLRTPYIYQYNLSVQRDLGHSLTGEVAYVGSTAHKLTALVDNNPMILGTKTRILNTQPGALSYSFSYMDMFKNVGYQNYNSLQTSLKKQLTGEGTKLGATYFTLAYTFAKNIDTASGFREGSSRVKAYNPGADRAVSDLDVKHRVVLSGGWDLPFNALWANGPKALTKGWNLNPIVTWRGGFPLDIRGFLKRSRTSPGPSGYGDQGLVRPNLVGNGVQTFDPYSDISDYGALYFSPANFNETYPAGTYTYGTLPRNFFRGPGRSNIDLSIGKSTTLTERAKLDFRVEFFNLLNSAQFDNPNLSPTSSSFGRITSTAAPRIMQLGAKVTF